MCFRSHPPSLIPLITSVLTVPSPSSKGSLLDTLGFIDFSEGKALMVNNNVGMSSAASIFQAVIGFILVLASNLLVRKINPENSLF